MKIYRKLLPGLVIALWCTAVYAAKPRIRISAPYDQAMFQHSERLGWFVLAKRGGGILPLGKKLKIYARIENDNRTNSRIITRLRLMNSQGMVFQEKFLHPTGERHKKISFQMPLRKGFHKFTIVAYLEAEPFHWVSDTVTIYEAVDPTQTGKFNIPSDTQWKNFNIAEKDLKKLNRKNPNSPQPHYYLSHIYFREGKWAKAIHEMKLAVKYAPNNAPILNDLGKLYYYHRMLKLASASFEKAVRLSPNVYEFHKNLSVNYYRLGERDKSLKEIEYLIRIKPKDPNLYQLAGVIALQMGNKKKGVQYLRKFLYYRQKIKQQTKKTPRKK